MTLNVAWKSLLCVCPSVEVPTRSFSCFKKCLAEGVQEVETTARTVHFQPTTLPATQHANITEPHAVLRFWTNSHKTQCSAEGSASRRTLTVTNRNQTIGHVCFWKTWGQTQSMSRCKRGYWLKDEHKKRGDRRGVVSRFFTKNSWTTNSTTWSARQSFSLTNALTDFR